MEESMRGDGNIHALEAKGGGEGEGMMVKRKITRIGIARGDGMSSGRVRAGEGDEAEGGEQRKDLPHSSDSATQIRRVTDVEGRRVVKEEAIQDDIEPGEVERVHGKRSPPLKSPPAPSPPPSATGGRHTSASTTAEPPVKKRKFSPIRWDKEKGRDSRGSSVSKGLPKARLATGPQPSPPRHAPTMTAQSGTKVGSTSTLPLNRTPGKPAAALLRAGRPSPSSLKASPSPPPLPTAPSSRPLPSPPLPPPPPPHSFSSRSSERTAGAEVSVPEEEMNDASTENGVETRQVLDGHSAMEVDPMPLLGGYGGATVHSNDEGATHEPQATIGTSRWAESVNTPDSERSPVINASQSQLVTSRNGFNLSVQGDSEAMVRDSGSEEGSPEPGEFFPGGIVERGNEYGSMDAAMGGGARAGRRNGSRDDEEYERELNRRELADLEKTEEEEEGDQEEQRPETDSEEDLKTPPQNGLAARRPRGGLRTRLIDMLKGCRSVDDYERLNRIDEGTYGVVYRARDKKTGEVVALKKVKMDKEREGFPLTSLREINILLSFHHQAIVDVKEVVVGSNLDSIFMVMEYMEHDVKSLMEAMKQPFSQSEVKCLMLQLLEGTKYLHENWVLHRDLKTSNLLLNNRGELKICDFGLARQYGSPLKAYTHMVVTLWYRAPELLLGAKLYSTAVDMWSLGCIMAELLSKDPLFAGKSEIDQIDKIFKLLGTPNERIWPDFISLPSVKKVNFVRQPYNKLREKFPAAAFGGRPTLSEAGFDLLNKLLTYDPKKRITAEAALQHEWFREVPLPKAQEFMPTFPARNEQDRRLRRLHKSPDPLDEAKRKPADVGAAGLFG